MENKKSLKNDKRAVAPVIGVILMVAITVILAAVIAAFVFGMGAPPTAPELYFSNLKCDSDNDKITATVVGSGNVSATSLTITYSVEGDWVDPDPLEDADFVGSPAAVGGGSILNYDASTGAPAAGDELHVVITHMPSGASLVDVTVRAK